MKQLQSSKRELIRWHDPLKLQSWCPKNLSHDSAFFFFRFSWMDTLLHDCKLGLHPRKWFHNVNYHVFTHFQFNFIACWWKCVMYMILCAWMHSAPHFLPWADIDSLRAIPHCGLNVVLAPSFLNDFVTHVALSCHSVTLYIIQGCDLSSFNQNSVLFFFFLQTRNGHYWNWHRSREIL